MATQKKTPQTTSAEFKLASDTIHRIDASGEMKLPADKVWDSVQQHTTMHTGFLPPSLRFYSRADNYEQIVIEVPPGVNHILWSDYEGGPKTVYELAQPWRIIIAHINQDNLVGCRMFYSPIQLQHLDQQLFNANVSNLNCMGYSGGVAVGWLCHYHGEGSWKGWSLAEKMQRIIERCGGGESYNFGNMRSTDGITFYKNAKKPTYTYDVNAWEKKSNKEGYEWTLDPELWIPVIVPSEDDQTRNVKKDENGVPLSLQIALNTVNGLYYNVPVGHNAAIKSRLNPEDTKESMLNVVDKSFALAFSQKR